MAGDRWSLVEYGERTPLLASISTATGLSISAVTSQLHWAGERAARALGYSHAPLEILQQSVRAVDFAGMLRAGPMIELEVAPKFLGTGFPDWREDFFFLAMLSRHGRLLSSERLRALASPNGDLATLVARALLQMFWDNHRRPIRTYKRVLERDFQIAGDLESEDVLLPDVEGFAQTTVRYDRTNPFNAAISNALSSLDTEVRDPETRAAMQRICQLLGKQAPLRDIRAKRLPSRSRPWQATYDLALDVLSGFGLTYNKGSAQAPGFVVDTWRIWEDLLTLSLRAHLGSKAVGAQRGLHLGTRTRLSSNGVDGARRVNVTPDILIDGSALGVSDVLVDAKYKGRVDQGRQRIAESDLYEAMAFAQASAGVKKVVLVYPKTAGSTPLPTGSSTPLERIDVGEIEVWGVETEVRGISRAGGVKLFAAGVISQIQTIAGVPIIPPPK